MTETAAAVDCVTIQMEAEELGEDGQEGEAAESTSASKTQFQVMQLFFINFFKIKFHGILIFKIEKKS